MYELVYGREAEEPTKAVMCSYCKGEIYEGEPFGTDGVKCVCNECIKDLFAARSLSEQFELLGFDAVEGDG